MRLRLVPRLVVALDAERKPHAFRLSPRADGSLRIARLPPDAALRTARGFILALDPSLGFWRNAQAMPRGHAELAAMAGDMFPFDPASVAYCASTSNPGARYHALRRADLDALLDEWRNPAAVIVAPAEPETLLAAITARIDRGAVTDLLPTPTRLAPVSLLLCASLATAAAAGIVAALVLWNVLLNDEQRELRHEVARLETEAAPALKQRLAILRMASALKEQAAFAHMPAGGAFAIVSRLTSRMPEGSALETIEFNGDSLTVTGVGADAQSWFAAAGVQPTAFKSDNLPKLTRFQATLSLKDSSPPLTTPAKDANKP